jgi:hypothetical protein
MSIGEAGAKATFREQIQRALDNMEKLRAKGKFQSHSSFWLGEKAVETYERKFADPHAREDSEYVMALASIRRGISNFVRITTGRDVPVVFSTGQKSFSTDDNEDLKTTEKVVISATADPAKFDVNVGLALHEAAHLCKSRINPGIPDSIPLFDFLSVLNNEKYVFADDDMKKEMSRLNVSEKEFRDLLKHIINVLEDRRIDQWMYSAAPGYRRYYDALYDYYWMGEKVTKLFDNPKVCIPTLRTYRFHITNMMNPRSDVSALPDLDKIFDLIDLENVARFGFDNRWTTYKNAVFPVMQSFNAMLGTGVTKPKKEDPLVFPSGSLPELVQVALDISKIILKNSVSKEITDEMPAPIVLPIKPIRVKGKGLDEEDEDEEAGSPFIVPAYDPDNLDSGSSSAPKTPSDQDQENKNSNDDEDADEDEDGQPSAGDEDADQDEKSSGDEDKKSSPASGQQPTSSLSSKLKKKSKIDKMLDEVNAEQKKTLEGDTSEDKESLDEKLAQQMSALEEANTEITDVKGEHFDGKAKVIIYNKLTPALLKLPNFHFGQANPDFGMDEVITRGINMGNILAHRLRILSEESPITHTRLTHGKLNKRALAGLGYDLDSVFQQTQFERLAPVYLHLTIDSSRSMLGKKFYNSMALAVALAQAAHKIRNLDVTISLRAAGPSMCYVLMAYDSRVDSIAHIKTHFRFLNANGGTPEGLAFAAIKDRIIADAPKTRKYFLNLSDGMPDFSWYETLANVNHRDYSDHHEYRGEASFTHTREQVQSLRDAGIRILSYYISDGGGGYYDTKASQEGFRKMYGSAAQFINPESIPQIVSTLNKLFLDNS